MNDDRLLLSEEDKDRQFVNALARGLEVLCCFGSTGQHYLGNAELAQLTGIPKPTISRLTYTLTKLGYLAYSDEQGKYELASRVLALGYSMLAHQNIRQIARAEMQSLAEHSKVSISIGIRDRLSMVYIETCHSSARVTLRLDVGSHIPLETTSMGKALLCALPQDERDFLMNQIRLHDEENWPRIKAGIELGFKEYEEYGFCLSLGDWLQDVHAVGVPFFNFKNQPTMVFNCGGPAFLLPPETLKNDLGPRLVELVRKIERQMGRN